MQLANDLRTLSMKAQQCLREARLPVEQAAQLVYDAPSMYILGKGPCEPIVREGALKVKEITYIHAESYTSGEFKHGPLSLIDSDSRTPAVFIMLNDEHFDDVMNSLKQIRGRKARTVVITDCRDRIDPKDADVIIDIPNCGMLTPLLAILPLQLLTYEAAKLLNRNLDKPRHLAKELTTN